MTGKQTSLRKRLWPKGPSKIIKKRKTFVTYNRRDHKLTGHQESWARSLAMSLSGWRTRQKFLKSQLEAHFKAEAERGVLHAQDTARYVVMLTQKDDLEAKLQAEAAQEYAKKAAVWADKASQMHQAGIGKKVIDGWDAAEEAYIRDSELEELVATAESEHSDDDREREEDHTDSDDSDQNIEIEVPDVPSLPKSQLAPIVQIAPVVDWRVKAHNGIIKKKLSITKGWSAVTWNQKSNVQERLLLLEHDGFDIKGLRDRKATSEEITAIILERAAAQQRPSITNDTLMQQPEELETQREGPQDSSLVWLDPVLRQSTSSLAMSASPSPKHAPSPRPQPTTDDPAAPLRQPVPVPEPQPAIAPVIEDNALPFCFDEPYQPQASPRLKRKRDRSIEQEDLEDAAGSFLAFKKRKVEDLTEDGLQLQALQEIKRKARFFCVASYGFEHMMGELRFLTGISNPSDTDISIYDPDFDKEPTYSSISAEDHIKQNLRKLQRQKSRIAISKDERGCLVIQGETRALAELFKVLGERGLYYTADWERDGLQLSPSNSFLWSLNPETQNTLMEAESRLKRYA